MSIAIDVLNINYIKLARILYHFFKPKDVLLGDSAFCSYADFFWISLLGCDAIVRKSNSRCQRLQGGIIVGKNDKIITWHKPKNLPRGITKEEFATLPKTQNIREISLRGRRYLFISSESMCH